jgi:coenzyme PQQ precursor peptide PqqA
MQYVIFIKEKTMKWSTPQATEMRYGFEITMYIANR